MVEGFGDANHVGKLGWKEEWKWRRGNGARFGRDDAAVLAIGILADFEKCFGRGVAKLERWKRDTKFWGDVDAFELCGTTKECQRTRTINI